MLQEVCTENACVAYRSNFHFPFPGVHSDVRVFQPQYVIELPIRRLLAIGSRLLAIGENKPWFNFIIWAWRYSLAKVYMNANVLFGWGSEAESLVIQMNKMRRISVLLEEDISTFSRVHATLHPALSVRPLVRPSVGPSVRPSVGPSVTLYFFCNKASTLRSF